MTAPSTRRVSPVRRSISVKPVTSEGVRSGVNWMRRKESPSAAASARTSVVFPTPGTSSISTCPPHSSAVRIRSTASPLPTTARATTSRMLCNVFSISMCLPPSVFRFDTFIIRFHSPAHKRNFSPAPPPRPARIVV